MTLVTLIPCRHAISCLVRKGSHLILRLDRQRLGTEARHSKLKKKMKKLEFEATTGVKDDVLLYSHAIGKMNTYYAVGSVFIAICCVNSAHFIYTTMGQLKKPVASDGSHPWYMWWENYYTGNEFVPTVFALILVLTGAAVIWMVHITISHQVKTITLLRGGEKLLLEHSTFLGGHVEKTLPLKEVSVVPPKHERATYVVKLKGERMNYLLDQKGIFHDRKMFNETIGVQRW